LCPRDATKYSTDKHLTKLGQDYLNTFNKHVHGHFFWNFRNELEPRWDYLKAYDAGWLQSPKPTATEFL